ncbi:MAG TPA: response regulator transcription factor [Pseudonocardiaceae bacterium]|jgi:two-component system response regulator DevR|nr:response regulator transcription factor [Pseudonocardiaceae bacterium]
MSRVSTRVFLVDSYDVSRRAIRAALEQHADLEVVGVASTSVEALLGIPRAAPDVAVLDLRLGDDSGVELWRQLKADLPTLRGLLLGSTADGAGLLDAFTSGASGFVRKEAPGEYLAGAVRTVAAGLHVMDEDSTSAVLERIRGERERRDLTSALTHREREVFGLLGAGLTNRQIAKRMYVADKTVTNYLARMLTKLGLQSRAQAAELARG